MRTVRKVGLSLIAPIIAILFSIGVAAIALALVGVNPGEAFSLMWDFGTTSTSVASMVNRAIPLYISAVAVAIGFKMGLFNIGVEGQFTVAALFAGWVGGSIALWAPLHVLVVILTAMVAGALWAGIAGVLKVTRGVNEVVATIMLNFIGFALVGFFLGNYFSVESGSLNQSTPPLPESGQLPGLNWIFTALGFSEPRGTVMQGFLLIAILVGIGYFVLVNKTRFGFDLRASGKNPGSARMSGVNPKKMILYTMLISGGVAGMVGLSTMFGKLYAYTSDFPRGLGFAGIAVALLGRNSAVGMALGALLFGFMERSALVLDLNDIPREVVQIIQGVVVLAVVIAYEVVNRFLQNREIKAASAATQKMEEQAEEVAA
ncbi:MAG: ABC transporter permease [Acidimicrobiia bacterium]